MPLLDHLGIAFVVDARSHHVERPLAQGDPALEPVLEVGPLRAVVGGGGAQQRVDSAPAASGPMQLRQDLLAELDRTLRVSAFLGAQLV